jgi:pyridoxine 4-dehydrogenase
MNVTPSQVGLAWLLRHAPNIVLIPGTASIEHLEQNIAAASLVLDQDAIADLNSL